MIRNIPNRYTTEDVLAEIDNRGFYKSYNYFYLPIDFANKVGSVLCGSPAHQGGQKQRYHVVYGEQRVPGSAETNSGQ